MSFDLAVVFTGLVGFVENTNINSRSRMCGLLVDGDPEKKSTFDKLPLRRHRAFVTFPIDNVSMGRDNQSLGVWYLERERLFFEVEEDKSASAGDNDFAVERMVVPQEGHPMEATNSNSASYTWALNMQRVYPRFRVDPRLLSQSPPHGTVAAQVVIDRGKVTTKSTTKAIFKYDSTLSGSSYTQVFAHEVMLSFKKLRAARIMAVSFDNPARRRFLDLTGLLRSGNGLMIQIINVCEHNPLQWDNDDAPAPDEDSRWIFEMVAPELHEDIHNTLAGRPLPIPRPLKIAVSGPGAPGSGNCIPPDVGSAPFGFMELDGVEFKDKVV